MTDIKGKRIYRTVHGSEGAIHHMEYNILMGWMCSCKSYMYRRVCRHVLDKNEEMNEQGRCVECDSYVPKKKDTSIKGTNMCGLWNLAIVRPETFTCGGWHNETVTT